MWRRPWPWIAGGVLVVLAIVAAVIAGGGDDAETSDSRPQATVTPPGAQVSTTTTQAAEDVPDAARSYFEAFVTEDLARMGAMLDSSVEGSPAAMYASHQIAMLRAFGPSPIGATMEVGSDNIAVNSHRFDPQGNEVEETATYGDFTVEGDKLSGFTVDDVPIADRIRAGDPAGASAEGVTVRVVTAYRTARGDLALNVDITNGREEGTIEVADYEWSLVTADGRQVASSQQVVNMAPGSIQPGATAGRAALFEQVGLGGTLRFVAFADDFVTEVRLDVPVPS